MTATCVIQARLGSTRLPGKVLRDVGGRPMLGLMLSRLEHLAVDHLVVATSDEARDGPIAELCDRLGVAVYRGSESDVLDRIVRAVERHPADDVIRLTADCPLSDPAVVHAVLTAHLAAGADYTSNTLLRTYPDGLDVEVIRSETLRLAHATATDPVEREHVTPWVYRHPEHNLLAAHRTDADAGAERWTVDTEDDLSRIREMVALVAPFSDPKDAPWTEFLDRYGRHAAPPADGIRLRPAGAEDGPNLLAWRNDRDSVRFSHSGRAVSEEDHAGWMSEHIDRPGTRIWIGLRGAQPVGQVRIDVADAIGDMSIAVDPGMRGCGYGSSLIAALQREVLNDLQVASLRASVRRDNAASRRIFERAGFGLIATGEFDLLEWVR